MKYYRKNYLIGIYYKDDEYKHLFTVLDNITQFAEFMNISYESAKVILHKSFNKEITFIRYFGKCCCIEFVNLD